MLEALRGCVRNTKWKHLNSWITIHYYITFSLLLRYVSPVMLLYSTSWLLILVSGRLQEVGINVTYFRWRYQNKAQWAHTFALGYSYQFPCKSKRLSLTSSTRTIEQLNFFTMTILIFSNSWVLNICRTGCYLLYLHFLENFTVLEWNDNWWN